MNKIDALAAYQDESRQPKNREKRTISSFTVASLHGKEVPTIPWFIRGIIPGEQVTSLYGDGAIGKTTIVMQLAVATVTGGKWLDFKPDPGPVVFVTCEDTKKLLHKRFVDIARGDLARLSDLHVIPLAGEDAILAAPLRGTEILEPTALWDAIIEKVEEVKPKLLIIDPLADVFGGDQISTPQAKQFINMLVRVAIRLELAVLVCAHPSAEGMRSGSGNSGSVAWNNSVRSRMLFELPKLPRSSNVDDEQGDDPNTRNLKVMKANYGPRGSELKLRWWPWGFEIDRGKTIGEGEAVDPRRAAADALVEEKFLYLLAKTSSHGQVVSHNTGRNYAPAVFAEHPEAGGHQKHRLCSRYEVSFRQGEDRNRIGQEKRKTAACNRSNAGKRTTSSQLPPSECGRMTSSTPPQRVINVHQRRPNGSSTPRTYPPHTPWR